MQEKGNRFKILDRSYEDGNFPDNLFDQLHRREIDVFILRNVLPASKAKQIADIILKYNGEGVIYHSTGSMFPRQFSSISGVQDIAALKKSWRNYQNELDKIDFDLSAWQKKLFQRLNKDKVLKSIHADTIDFTWGWATLRNCPAGQRF